jgi:hypothetical protein
MERVFTSGKFCFEEKKKRQSHTHWQANVLGSSVGLVRSKKCYFKSHTERCTWSRTQWKLGCREKMWRCDIVRSFVIDWATIIDMLVTKTLFPLRILLSFRSQKVRPGSIGLHRFSFFFLSLMFYLALFFMDLMFLSHRFNKRFDVFGNDGNYFFEVIARLLRVFRVFLAWTRLTFSSPVLGIP